MDWITRLAVNLPKLKTKLQLTGLIALVGGTIATRAIRPDALLAQICAGAIGVLFLVFGQVFSSLGQVEQRERATLVLRLFIIFIVFILALVLMTGIFLASAAPTGKQSSQHVEASGDCSVANSGNGNTINSDCGKTTLPGKNGK